MPDKKLIEKLRSQRPVKVLFVCLGNICRSPAADGIMRHVVEENRDSDRWIIDSAGTAGYHVGDLPDRRMRVHGRQRGLEFDHICRQVKASDFDEFDLIVPMDEANRRDLLEMSPTAETDAKIVPMAEFLSPGFGYDYVPDPYYEGAEGFELVLDLLMDGCRNLYNIIAK